MQDEDVAGLHFRGGEGADAVTSDFSLGEDAVLVTAGAELEGSVKEGGVVEGEAEDQDVVVVRGFDRGLMPGFGGCAAGTQRCFECAAIAAEEFGGYRLKQGVDGIDQLLAAGSCVGWEARLQVRQR